MKATAGSTKADISHRLKVVRRALGVTQVAMALKMGLGQSTWSAYESGGSLPSLEILSRLAGHGFDLHWLITGDGEMLRDSRVVVQSESVIMPGFLSPASYPSANEIELDEEARLIPVLRVPLLADGPGEGVPTVSSFGALPEFWLTDMANLDPGNSFLVEVQGDAMSPMLEEGDLVLGELEDRVERGVYAASLDGYLRVAHFFRRGDVIVMKDEYEEREVQDEPSFRLIGRVRRRLTGLR